MIYTKVSIESNNEDIVHTANELQSVPNDTTVLYTLHTLEN